MRCFTLPFVIIVCGCITSLVRAQNEPLPPHHPLQIPGVHAYPGEQSVVAGGTLELHVSSSVGYRLSICRLGPKVDDPAAEEVVAEFPPAEPHPLPIFPGSYIHVERSIQEVPRQLSLECWVRPWKLKQRAALLTQWDYPSSCGFGLFLEPEGQVVFYLGDGGQHRESFEHRAGQLIEQQWHHVVATWDGQQKSVWIDGKLAGRWPHVETVATGTSPLRIGAAGRQGRADAFVDADIAMPCIYGRALNESDVHQRYESRGLAVPDDESLWAVWPLDEERGDTVRDHSRYERHGRIINHATWMIGGPAFNAAVERYGNYDPKHDPKRGHGLRLASDDLYDCQWPVRHTWHVPRDAKPGFYVARFTFDYEGKPRVNYVTFLVRRAPDKPAAPILVLAATNTWRAYSGTPFAITPAERKQVWGTGGIANGPTSPPAFNLYRAHAAGQGTYQGTSDQLAVNERIGSMDSVI